MRLIRPYLRPICGKWLLGWCRFGVVFRVGRVCGDGDAFLPGWRSQGRIARLTAASYPSAARRRKEGGSLGCGTVSLRARSPQPLLQHFQDCGSLFVEEDGAL